MVESSQSRPLAGPLALNLGSVLTASTASSGQGSCGDWRQSSCQNQRLDLAGCVPSRYPRLEVVGLSRGVSSISDLGEQGDARRHPQGVVGEDEDAVLVPEPHQVLASAQGV